MLGAELLAGPLKVIHHRQDLRHVGAGDLQLQIIPVAALTLAEIIEIGGHPHVLAAQVLVFGLQGSEFSLQLAQAVTALGPGGIGGIGGGGSLLSGRLARGLRRGIARGGRVGRAAAGGGVRRGGGSLRRIVGELGNRCRVAAHAACRASRVPIC